MTTTSATITLPAEFVAAVHFHVAPTRVRGEARERRFAILEAVLRITRRSIEVGGCVVTSEFETTETFALAFNVMVKHGWARRIAEGVFVVALS